MPVEVAPVIGHRCPRDLKQPCLHALLLPPRVNAARCLHEHLGSQVLSFFPVAHFGVDEVIDSRDVTRVQRLEALRTPVAASRGAYLAAVGPAIVLHLRPPQRHVRLPFADVTAHRTTFGRRTARARHGPVSMHATRASYTLPVASREWYD